MIADDWLPLQSPEAAYAQAPAATLRAVAELLWLATRHNQAEQFLPEALGAIAQALAGEFVALAAAEQGEWLIRAQLGRSRPLPKEFLGEVLDRAAVGKANFSELTWLGSPLDPRGTTGEVLLVAGFPPHRVHQRVAVISDRSREHLGPCTHLAILAPIFSQCLEAVREKSRDQRRAARLGAVLEIAGQWNQTREMEPLLVQMATAACRLLGADRASIFLWDRPAEELVGRPALGVEGGELRVPQDAGVVGRVLQTGEPQRVNEQAAEGLVDRHVDQQLGYQTRTLVCVPMISSEGERLGVFEVLNKHSGAFSADDEAVLAELAHQAAIALENTQERESLLASRRQIAEQAAQQVRLIGQSPAIGALRGTISRVANTDLAVLILGENGTGKEVVSQLIHYLSPRRDQPLIAINCAALTETLLESELFGHEKGAFTDAHESRPGKFELASGGTLFLDEIGDLSPGGQAKLLRVLEEKTVIRVGGSKAIHTDARVLAATNQDLAEMVRQKRFRQDLYYRLAVVTLELPALRDRPEDIMLLAEHFLEDFCRRARRKQVPTFSADARRRLQRHHWPGNVREVRNLMERLAYLASGDRVEAEDLEFILPPPSGSESPLTVDLPLTDATRRFQAEYIKRAIARARGNMTGAAELLGLHRSNLYRKMKQLHMDLAEGEPR